MAVYTHLLFDADNTLFDFHQASKIAFGNMMSSFRLEHSASHYDRYHSYNIKVWDEFELGEIDALSLRSKRFRLFFEDQGISIDPIEANAIYLDNLARTPILLEGVPSLLENLRERYSLSIITNGLKEVQRKRIEEANLTHYFETIVVSDEIGMAKPNAEYFEYTLEKLDYPNKENILVIGDSLSSDIKGAMNAGIDSCWFNPHKKDLHSGIKPTFTIDELKDIHSIL